MYYFIVFMRTNHLDTLCDLFYQANHIPIYCYENGREDVFYLSWFRKPIEKIDKTNNDLYLFSDESFFTWCIIQKHDSEKYVLIGPVFSVPVDVDEVYTYMKQNAIPDGYRQKAFEFFKQIPVMPFSRFSSLIRLLFYEINRVVLDDESFFSFLLNEESDALHRPEYYKDRNKDIEEFLSFDSANAVEEMILHCIETNDIAKLKKIIIDPTLEYPNIGNTPMSQQKMSSIIIITVISRFVIRKGMNINVSLRLSDLYIQSIEAAATTDELRMIMLDAYTEYADRLQSLNELRASSQLIRNCIQFIRQNVNTPVYPSTVADYVDRSLSYLSARFKKETGITISEFIRSAKLDEAKSLLEHTDMTVSQISNYLCFSDQSYFHREFKKYTGMTPIQYRRSI